MRVTFLPVAFLTLCPGSCFRVATGRHGFGQNGMSQGPHVAKASEGEFAHDWQSSSSPHGRRQPRLKKQVTLKTSAAFLLALLPEPSVAFSFGRVAPIHSVLQQGPSSQLAVAPKPPDLLSLPFPKLSEPLPVYEALSGLGGQSLKALSALGASLNDAMTALAAAIAAVLTDPAGAMMDLPAAIAYALASAESEAVAAFTTGSVAATDAAVAVSNAIIEASGALWSIDPSIALFTLVTSALKVLLLDDVEETSFTTVARWPEVKLYTFGEAAYRPEREKANEYGFAGMRVNVALDPVPNVAGQAIGNVHSETMVPALNLDIEELNSTAQDVPDEVTGSAVGENMLASLDDSEIDEGKVSMQGMSSSSDFSKLFAGSDWARHDMIVYSDLIEQKLKESSESSLLETYRMGKIVQDISYVDAANMTEISAGVTTLNARKDPQNLDRPLFDKQLEHVMSIQFFTPASLQARFINQFGSLLSEDQAPVASEGISHNVHLIKDADNNGYLTFQGTANLGTWLDVNLNIERYQGDQQNPFASAVDDVRWAGIEQAFLFSCHRGMVETLQTFLKDENFPELARKVVELKSLTMTGFSLGGSLASMFAVSVRETGDLQGILDRVLDSRLYRALFRSNSTVPVTSSHAFSTLQSPQ